MLALLASAVPLAAQAETVLDLTPTCPECELSFQEILHLSSEREEVGPLVYASSATIDGRGRFWVSFGNAASPQVFSLPDGALLENIGRQGEGPGEFMAPTMLLPAGDSVLVFDQLLERLTVIGPELRAARTVPLRGDFRNGAVIEWPMAVLSGVVPTPESAGRPFHLVNLATGEVEASFGGSAEGGFSALSQHLLRGHAGVVPDHRSIWTVGRSELKVQQWTPDGALIRTLEASPEWFPPAIRPPGLGSPSTRPIPWIADMAVTDDGIWLAIRALAETGREAWTDATAQPGHGGPGASPESWPDPDLLFQGRVLLLDPTTARVVNSWDIDLSALGGGTIPGGTLGFVGLRTVFPALSVRQFRLESR